MLNDKDRKYEGMNTLWWWYKYYVGNDVMIISTDNHECIEGNHADKDRLLIDMIWYVDVE